MYKKIYTTGFMQVSGRAGKHLNNSIKEENKKQYINAKCILILYTIRRLAE
jgi:hypothetical protein